MSTLETRIKNLELEFVIAPPEVGDDGDDGDEFNPDDYVFAFVLVNQELASGPCEEFWAETGNNGAACVFDADGLEAWFIKEKHKKIVCVFDASRCDKQRFLTARNYSQTLPNIKRGEVWMGFLPQTDPNTPAREEEVRQFVEASVPQVTEANLEKVLYVWREGEVKPGFFLAQWQAAQVAAKGL